MKRRSARLGELASDELFDSLATDVEHLTLICPNCRQVGEYDCNICYGELVYELQLPLRETIQYLGKPFSKRWLSSNSRFA